MNYIKGNENILYDWLLYVWLIAHTHKILNGLCTANRLFLRCGSTVGRAGNPFRPQQSWTRTLPEHEINLCTMSFQLTLCLNHMAFIQHIVSAL